MTIEYLKSCLELARQCPKLNPNEGSECDTGQFGNNFYMLFMAQRVRETQPDLADQHKLVKIYLLAAESYGEKWTEFLNQNRKLLENIYEILEGDYEKYRELSKCSRNFLVQKRYDDDDLLEKEIGHPLGLDAVRIHIWRRLNPLLKQAAIGMINLGIPLKEFGGVTEEETL